MINKLNFSLILKEKLKFIRFITKKQRTTKNFRKLM